MMKKLLILLTIVSAHACFADDVPMYGTADKPVINGVAYDVHKQYIEDNPGHHLASQDSSAPDDVKPKQIMVKPANELAKTHTQVETPVNFKSDSWANDSKDA